MISAVVRGNRERGALGVAGVDQRLERAERSVGEREEAVDPLGREIRLREAFGWKLAERLFCDGVFGKGLRPVAFRRGVDHRAHAIRGADDEEVADDGCREAPIVFAKLGPLVVLGLGRAGSDRRLVLASALGVCDLQHLHLLGPGASRHDGDRDLAAEPWLDVLGEVRRLTRSAEEKRSGQSEHLPSQERSPCAYRRRILGLFGTRRDVHMDVGERVRRDDRNGIVVGRTVVAPRRSAWQVRNHQERDDRDQRDGARDHSSAVPPLRRDRFPCGGQAVADAAKRATQQVEEVAEEVAEARGGGPPRP